MQDSKKNNIEICEAQKKFRKPIKHLQQLDTIVQTRSNLLK